MLGLAKGSSGRDREIVVSNIERVLLLSWIIKDFGWMTTNVYLGFTFGAVSVLMHVALPFLDRRRSFLYYEIAMIFWVTGNFLWMSTEFFAITPSSRMYVYFGLTAISSLLRKANGTLEPSVSIETRLRSDSNRFQTIRWQLLVN
jgi:hypothetical protein